MADIQKMIQGKKLTELDEQILKYIVDNIDHVLQMGVREIAKENYTSPATVIRLSKKLGYKGFVDMYYQLLPLIKKVELEQDGQSAFEQGQSALQYNSKENIGKFIENVLHLNEKFIFIYATGFSSIIAEYMYKKLLVLGKKAIFATGTDSIGVFENNLDDVGALIVISKSGETKQVIDKLFLAKEHGIFTVSFTKETENTAAGLSDLNLKITDQYKLDDRNMLPNLFFPNVLILFEYMIKEYFQQIK
ncbi:MurR/RpiR family transcriptional regulator [Weizmannia coagulans]|uniref:RpiR family transcriptional regulator n=2 Tax=Heyndrickxia TaxID=2837504 RepID=A0AAN0T5K1_HEYCO|nr:MULTISPECIES: MurR/RpiR family transcriptional regulator [Heyndrickxia]AJO21426.1 RpiR family transcriptional regulator [Heyndrickxia coagulans]AKN52947.1 Transcriptional regulator, RpiR family [Heyndrickxia coagulans]ATW82009.1 MurR/RpiR family transcriptional regulator [Heyndrickxia coagulans]AWP38270.1 MurR/RpiR family transcriptional regulator [Heyndrickxia coagulans]KGB29509.1 RpiR family transcriptional regulator [Heyndrickxia coagulans]